MAASFPVHQMQDITRRIKQLISSSPMPCLPNLFFSSPSFMLKESREPMFELAPALKISITKNALSNCLTHIPAGNDLFLLSLSYAICFCHSFFHAWRNFNVCTNYCQKFCVSCFTLWHCGRTSDGARMPTFYWKI